MTYAYKQACSEVCFILDNLEEGLKERIPENMLNLLHKNKVKYYETKIDVSIPLNQQELKDETKAILALLYRKYLCSDEEKAILEENFQKRLKEEMELRKANTKKAKYVDKSVKKIEPIVTNEEIQENIQEINKEIKKEESLIEHKENIFSKILVKIKKFFRIS